MRPTWLLSGQVDGSVVRRPELFGTALTELLGMRARYLRVTETAIIMSGNNIIGTHFIDCKILESDQRLYCQSLSQKAKFGVGLKAASICVTHIPPRSTHRVPPLAPSWWCFRHWVLIHRTLRRNYHTGYRHWHQNTLQLSLPQKEAPGMNYSQLKAEPGRNTKYEPWNSRREHEPEVPDDGWAFRLTSADWWLLLASQVSCSFCLSWDRVSCTDFKEASTVERGKEWLRSVWNLSSRLCRSSDLAGRRCRCPAGFSCSRRTAWR